jgi:hypothetical protein
LTWTAFGVKQLKLTGVLSYDFSTKRGITIPEHKRKKGSGYS